MREKKEWRRRRREVRHKWVQLAEFSPVISTVSSITLGCYSAYKCVCLLARWHKSVLVKSHKQDTLKQKCALTGTRRKQGYGDVVCISIFKCISGHYTNLFHQAPHGPGNGEAVGLQRVRAEQAAEVTALKRPGLYACALEECHSSSGAEELVVAGSVFPPPPPPAQLFLFSGLFCWFFTCFHLFLVPWSHLCIFVVIFVPPHCLVLF